MAYEAYAIDSTHIDTLDFLVKIDIKLSKFEEAQYHAELLMELYPENATVSIQSFFWCLVGEKI